MHIPVSAVPQHGLVVQIVKHHSSVGCGAIFFREVVDPAGNKRGGDGDTCIKWIVPGNRRTTGQYTVTTIRIPLRVVTFLIAIFADLKATIIGLATWTAFRHPTDERHCHQCLRARSEILVHK